MIEMTYQIRRQQVPICTQIYSSFFQRDVKASLCRLLSKIIKLNRRTRLKCRVGACVTDCDRNKLERFVLLDFFITRFGNESDLSTSNSPWK